MKTYLITGGAGFIGSHLADRFLQEGQKVIVVDNFNDFYSPNIKENNVKQHLNNPNYQLERMDIREEEKLESVFEKHKIDTIIHLAAMAGVRPSIQNPKLYQEVNGTGSMNILELAKKYQIQSLVMASSSSVYGNNKKVPFSEEDRVDNAISPYAATKKANEVMAHAYHHLYGMSIIMLRFFTVYGERQRPDLAITKFTRLMLAGKDIPMYGDGTTARDYTYIGDIIDGILKSITYAENHKNVYEVLNLGEATPIPLKTMIATIGKALNIQPKVKELPMQPGDVKITYADITKARELIGYQPKVSFEEGIRRFVDWYQKNRK